MKLRLLSMLAWGLLSTAARGQLTTFTYQGRLDSGGAPAQGLHDLRFRLFDAPAGGAPVGVRVCADDVPVAGGVFRVELDFGAVFTTPDARYLEVEVRRDSGLNCSNAAGFVVLSPRQRITAAPLAAHARSAFSLAAADGSPAQAVVVDATGKVGVGTATPGTQLDVVSGFVGDGVRLVGAANSDPAFHLYDGATPRGALALAMGAGNWSAGAFSGDIVLRTQFVNNRLLMQNGAGAPALAVASNRVGVGTTLPTDALDVRGGVRLGSAGELHAPGGVESLRIVRGVVGASGGVFSGSGFRVTHPLPGHYTITFDTPFRTPPTVTVTPEYDGWTVLAMTDGVTTDFANILVRLSYVFNEPLDATFHFTAIGAR